MCDIVSYVLSKEKIQVLTYVINVLKRSISRHLID